MSEGMIGTMIGAVLGFLLGQLGIALQERRNDKKRSQSVRKILSIEIDENLYLIWQYWRSNDGKMLDADNWNLKTAEAQGFILGAHPKFQRKALDSQLPILASVLNVDEISKVFEFYNLLSILEAKEMRLKQLWEDEKKQQEETKRQVWEGTLDGQFPHIEPPAKPFATTAAVWWDEVDTTVQTLRANGNPLAPKKI